MEKETVPAEGAGKDLNLEEKKQHLEWSATS